MSQVIVETLEAMPEGLHSFFEKTDEGFSFTGVSQSDVAGLKKKATELLGEVKTSKEKLATFAGIEDPKAAIEAMSKLKGFDQKKLVDAGKLEELKSQLTEELNAKVAAKDTEIAEMNQALNGEMIGGRFARSKFIEDSLVIPADMVEATFGKHFSIVEGRVVATGADGQTITSDKNFGEPAAFDEALAKLVDAYPHKDRILKATTKGGSGMTQGGKSGGKNIITRTQFDALAPVEKVKFLKDGGGVTD